MSGWILHHNFKAESLRGLLHGLQETQRATRVEWRQKPSGVGSLHQILLQNCLPKLAGPVEPLGCIATLFGVEGLYNLIRPGVDIC